MSRVSEFLKKLTPWLNIADLLTGGTGSGYTAAQLEQFRRSVAKAGYGAYLPSRNTDIVPYLIAVGNAVKDTFEHGDKA